MRNFIVSWAISLPMYILLFQGMEAVGVKEWYYQIPVCMVVTFLFEVSRKMDREAAES